MFIGSLSVMAVTAMVPIMVQAETETETKTKDTIVLYTNDVHCAIDDYSKFAAYREQLEQEGHKVIVVDAGDAIQGEAIGSLTEGSAIIDLMKAAEYDFAVAGNHEFDYGMETFLKLAGQDADFQYLGSNFIDLRTQSSVFPSYQIVTIGEEDIAFIGISTPESYTKSTPTYFQDENGNDIYGFAQDNFYGIIQTAIDAAVTEGADRVIAVGHLGITGTTEGWKSTDVIANTTGIDVFLDAHTHEVIAGELYTDKSGAEVLLSSTGTKFQYFGQLTLSENNAETTELINPDTIDVTTYSSAAQAEYKEVQDKIDAYNDELAYLYEELGTAEVELTLYHPDSGDWIIRTSETNMGDFVADAYRQISGAEIALVNSGGIRDLIEAGEVTRKDLMDVNPWNNEMCVIEATGQQILDALEHGARLYPETCGGFLQVSGLTCEIQSWRESPVVLDDKGSFKEIDTTKERRVTNVKVNGTALDPVKTYTVVGSYYTLKNGGDGFTMFADAEVVKKEGLPTDAQMLEQYFTETLGGIVTKEQYGNALGDGRIVVYTEEQKAPEDTDNGNNDAGQVPGDTTTDGGKNDTAAGNTNDNKSENVQKESVKTGDESKL